ncbi:MAG: diacylglycerol kinase family protein [Candidatus Omnitrophica bacterium]|nr:diacylglycerol kinase family protein [Candidatus Omnitrophota bacterium]
MKPFERKEDSSETGGAKTGPPPPRTFSADLAEQLGGIGVSFGHAIRGFLFALRSQRNLRVHCLAGCAALSLAWVLKLTRLEVILLILTISLVILGEMLNTAIELTLNLLEARNHPVAKMAKDVAAGGVLLAVAGSVAVGIFLFGRRLMSIAETLLL